MPDEILIKCPYCESQDIEPLGSMFHCKTCKQDFPEAMVQLIEPPKQKKGK